MNEQLIKFIELCLVDGVISDKEREVIFRKSKEFGVPFPSSPNQQRRMYLIH